jgi:hypothetical protein
MMRPSTLVFVTLTAIRTFDGGARDCRSDPTGTVVNRQPSSSVGIR